MTSSSKDRGFSSRRLWTALILCALASLPLFWELLGGCGSQPEEDLEIDPEALEAAHEFTLTQTVEGRKAWVVEAESARSLRDEGFITIYGPRVDFYSKEEKVYSTLESDSGVYYIESTDIEALGNVVVVSADSAVLEADSLKWVSKERKIRTEGHVKVTKGSTVITGDGLVSDPGLEDIEIERNFQATTREHEVDEELR